MSARNRFGRRLGFGLGMAMLALSTAGCIDDFDKVGDGQFGSGPTCESLCERASDCEGSEPTDCEADCEETERMAERAGCLDVFRDVMSCASEVSDICNVSQDECSAEIEAYGSCLSAYCDPNYDLCADYD